MKVLLFGATGMVGQGVLRECLLDERVEMVLAVGRGKTGTQHPKLREIGKKDLYEFASLEPELRGLDACFFCLGVSSVGMQEERYRRITYDITLAAATTMARLNPGSVFIYVSGTGTDSTEKGPTMWARVKGQVENALLRLPFKAAYMFRPGLIQPLHGITSKTKLYRFFLVIGRPLFPVLKALFPDRFTTTERVGRAMINISIQAPASMRLESRDINKWGRKGG